jgi:hypothetical protein
MRVSTLHVPSPATRECQGRAYSQLGATAVETALTMPLFVISIFTVFFFMIAGYRSVALQLLTSEMAESLAVGSVCSKDAGTVLMTRATNMYVPLSNGEIKHFTANGPVAGFPASPGLTQPIFSLTLESTVTIPVFNFDFRLYGLAFGVAESTAC